MKSDASAWIWGTIWHQSNGTCVYYRNPVKILDDVVLVTGGSFNHAALQRNGSVWTWGYNYTGNCGVEEQRVVSVPTKVAEGVIMVWTGSLEYNIENTSLDDEFERELQNTIIQLEDGSRWICGLDVGEEEKTIPFYFEAAEWTGVCTHEFMPFDGEV